jgi:hypothetical protein
MDDVSKKVTEGWKADSREPETSSSHQMPGQSRPARSRDGTGADVALRSAGARVDLRAVGAGYVGAETCGSRTPFPPPAKARPDSQTLPFARDTYFFRTDLMVA